MAKKKVARYSFRWIFATINVFAELSVNAQLYCLDFAHKSYPYYFISGGGGVSSLSMHATAGSDLADDFDNLSHDPLQTAMSSERGFASSNVETFLPPRWREKIFSSMV